MNPLILLLVIGLVLAAFAAGAETALTSASRLRIRSLADEGDKRARKLTVLHQDPNAYLSTILSVNMVAVIVATNAATRLALGLRSLGDALFVGTFSIAVLVFCEIAPK